MDYDKLSSQIIELVGGKANIREVFHCVTRLRLLRLRLFRLLGARNYLDVDRQMRQHLDDVFADLFDKLPTVERIEKVDIPRSAV